MKADKKVIESITVASLAMALAITAVTGNGINTAGHSQAVETQLEENGIAGVAVTVNRYNEEAANELNNLSIEKEEVDILAASAEPEVSTEDEMAAVREAAVSIKDTISAKDVSAEEKDTSAKEDKWENKLMAKVDNFLYVREKPDADSKVVGKMYKGDCATITKTGKTWTKIKSGKVTGYVKNEYCITGKKAYKYAKKHCDTVAKVSIDGLRIRKKPSTDAAVIKAVVSGDKLVVDTKAKKKDGWVAVKVDSSTCYVSDEYVTVKLNTGKAITLADEMAAWKAAQERKAAANAASSGNSSSSAGSSNAPTSVTADDETLLAALIQCEAGGEGSQCMTAVAAVVLNRVHSGSFPNTIRGVIYQSGQFGPASSGRLASRLANGVSSSARAAARAALNGSDPTGGAKYFKLASSGHPGVVIGAVVFY